MKRWRKEDVPVDALLYMRVHVNDVVIVDQNGSTKRHPKPGVFKNRLDPEEPTKPTGMSTDWDKYATPQETQSRAERSEPTDNGVLRLSAGRVAKIPRQRIEHTPKQRTPVNPLWRGNRAHTDVFGPKSPKEGKTPDERMEIAQVRFDLLEICEWAILPPDDPEEE